LDASPHKVSGRTAAGATVLIASKLIARCLDLATIVVLGRLLSPADFGLVAIAMSIVMVVEAILELLFAGGSGGVDPVRLVLAVGPNLWR
jgi:PST family polysaccharide transporter